MAPRARTTCRFWLTGRCALNDAECKFLHSTEGTTPHCRFGARCKAPRCTLAHHAPPPPPLGGEAPLECVNYSLGFCPLGHRCAFAHVVRPPSDLPPVSLARTPLYGAWLEAWERMRASAQPTKRLHSAPCSLHAAQGFCPFFGMCSFRHDTAAAPESGPTSRPTTG